MIGASSSQGPRHVAVAGVLAALLVLAAGCSAEPAAGAATSADADRGQGAGLPEITLDQAPGSTRQAAELVAAQAGLVLANPHALPGDDVYSNPVRAMPARAALASVAASVGTGMALGEDGQVRFGETTTLEAWQDEQRRPQFAVHADNVDGWQVLRLAASRSGMSLMQDGAVTEEPRPVVMNFYQIPARTLYAILAEELGVSITLHGDAVMVGKSADAAITR